MSCCDDREFLEARLARTKALILQYEDALAAIAGGAQNYTVDSGQMRITYTGATLGEARLALKELEQRRRELMTELGCGTSSVYVGPAF